MKMPIPYDRSSNDTVKSKKLKSLPTQSLDPNAPYYIQNSWPSTHQGNKNKKRYILIGV